MVKCVDRDDTVSTSCHFAAMAMTWCKWETSLRVTPFQISEVKNLNLLEVWGLRAPWILDQIPAGIFFLGAKRTVHERASFDSLQFTHCTRTTGQCRTTQRGKSQFDTCQHPAPFILLGIQAIKDVWPPLSRDILYWLRPQKLKGWLYFVLRFYHIIYRYVRIYFIYLHHAAFSMFANQATIAQMFPHAAQGGRRGCRYFWEWAFPKGFLGKTWNPGSKCEWRYKTWIHRPWNKEWWIWGCCTQLWTHPENWASLDLPLHSRIMPTVCGEASQTNTFTQIINWFARWDGGHGAVLLLIFSGVLNVNQKMSQSRKKWVELKLGYKCIYIYV